MRAADLPRRFNAAQLLEDNLVERAGKVALRGPAGERTFGEVSAEADALGNALVELGCKARDPVAILLPDLAEWPSCFFGTLRVGGIALGMNTLLTPREHHHILADSRARVLIGDRDLLAALSRTLEDSGAALPDLRHVVVLDRGSKSGEEPVRGDAAFGRQAEVHDYRSVVDAAPAECAPTPTERDDPATLNYSSGTTGIPKGILHVHQDLALCAELWGVSCLGLREDDVTYSNAKLFFTYGLGGGLLFPWHVGASTVLNPGPARDTPTVLEVIERDRPSVFYNAPTGYAAMLAELGKPGSHDLSSLRLCVSAGEALPAPVWHAWREATGLEIIDGIGSTELFHIFISNRPGDVRPGSSGRPVAGYAAKVLDDDGRPVGTDVVGNLWIKGESAAHGYLNQEGLSRRTFVDGWVRTGDKYSVDEDGYFWHAGRADDMLKVGGIWVSPVEVESVLVAHPAVLECAVAGVPDSADLTKPKAWVVPRPGWLASVELEDELIRYCAERMAAYKRPRWIEFTDELPKTATGKVRRFKLRETT